MTVLHNLVMDYCHIVSHAHSRFISVPYTFSIVRHVILFTYFVYTPLQPALGVGQPPALHLNMLLQHTLLHSQSPHRS